MKYNPKLDKVKKICVGKKALSLKILQVHLMYIRIIKQTDYYPTIIYSSLLSPWEHNLSFVCAISVIMIIGCSLLLIAEKKYSKT